MSRPVEFSRRQVFTATAGALGALGVWALSGCATGKPDVVPSADDVEPAITVEVIDNRFEPREISVQAGDAVRWEFLGNSEHDVVAKDGSFVSELMSSGSYTHVFEESGSFDYDCSIHPEMTGVVHVS